MKLYIRSIYSYPYLGDYIKHITGKVNGRFRYGRILSPNYPSEYPSDMECVWKIRVPGNAVLQLNLQDFEIEVDPKCSHDFLEIHHLSADGSIKR